jgi:hypothetical protein
MERCSNLFWYLDNLRRLWSIKILSSLSFSFVFISPPPFSLFPPFSAFLDHTNPACGKRRKKGKGGGEMKRKEQKRELRILMDIKTGSHCTVTKILGSFK